MEDTGRITQKFLLGRGDTNDLLAVKKTIQTWTDIIRRIEDERRLEAGERENFNSADWKSMDTLISRMAGLYDLSKRIGSAIEDASSMNDDSGGDEPPEPVINDQHDLSPNDTDSNSFWRHGTGKWVIKPG